MSHTMLVALDATDLAPLVLGAAIDMARSEGARLRLVHVVPVPRELPPGLLVRGPASVTEFFEDAGRARLEEYAKAVPTELLAGIDLRMGTAWREICAIAHDAHADLIVLGAHRHGAMDRMLGTTAAKVVNHADRSVFIVRAKRGL